MKSAALRKILFIGYVAFFIGMACSFRAVSSISLVWISIFSFYYQYETSGRWINDQLKNGILVGCILYLIVQSLGLLYAHDKENLWRHIQLKSALVFIPVAIWSSSFTEQYRDKLLSYYTAIISLSLLFCIGCAVYRVCWHDAATDTLFYHELVSPFKHHAVHFSIMIFVALFFLVESRTKGVSVYPLFLENLLIIFLFVGILLLSSKFVILCTLITFAYYLLIHWGKMAILTGLGIIALVVLILFINKGDDPITRRFSDIFKGNELIHQTTYDPAIYFNGVQFRLLQWRLVPELLNEKHKWLSGLSAGDAQSALDSTYRSHGMYMGDPGKSTGFQNYNTHNQFLEALLQSGIPGLAILFFIVAMLIRYSVKKGKTFMLATTFMVVLYAFVESVFETQYGLVLFCFLPILLVKKSP